MRPESRFECSDLPPLVATLRLLRADGTRDAQLALTGDAAFRRLDALASWFLHPDECAAYAQMVHPRRRRGFLLGRWAAKAAIAALAGAADPAQICIEPGIFGQPLVRGASGVGIGITHADHLAAALAFPDGHPMGLDAEQVARDRVDVVAGELTAAEAEMGRDLFGGHDGEATRHVLLWTAKEAIAKVLRCGLMTPFRVFATAGLARCSTAATALPGFSAQFCGEYVDFTQYRFHTWVGQGHVLTIALPRRTRVEVEVRKQALLF